jgi:hypothetical protein
MGGLYVDWAFSDSAFCWFALEDRKRKSIRPCRTNKRLIVAFILFCSFDM